MPHCSCSMAFFVLFPTKLTLFIIFLMPSNFFGHSKVVFGMCSWAWSYGRMSLGSAREVVWTVPVWFLLQLCLYLLIRVDESEKTMTNFLRMFGEERVMRQGKSKGKPPYTWDFLLHGWSSSHSECGEILLNRRNQRSLFFLLLVGSHRYDQSPASS